MKDLVEFISSIRPSEIWYFNYGTWGLLSFLWYARGQIILSAVYGIGSLIAYALATWHTKLEKRNVYF